MKIYTSYFAKTKQLVDAGIMPIGIAQIPPTFFKYPNMGCVAPSKDILFEYKSILDKERYITRYKEEILPCIKNIQVFIDSLESLSDGKDVALCCYEKPGDFCHRHLLADYLNEQSDLDIQEYNFGDEISVDELF